MSATAPKPNGRSTFIGHYEPAVFELPSFPVTQVPEPQPGSYTPPSSGAISVERLYGYHSATAAKVVVEAPAALISQIVGESLVHLGRAIREQEELARENHVAVALEILSGIAKFVGTHPNFDDLLSTLLVAIAAHRTTPYSRTELTSLANILEQVRTNPTPTFEKLSELYDSLEAAGFDLNAPLAGVELTPNEGGE